ncbi:MAG: hypothetical protein A2729_02825 [Candidatus Buchananbacteria bacterium RIFCSPHIGHO2_01_FULL_39_14]|uniref:Uncharacterized protein n=2 Tax=Candidatus Buchananiibacteriota TaxID=1817903 RepID=A0A1G1YTG1_9BACT|nr:MAG: hypothetical protein A2729_02825 [Candidatus Buchananbacteria bacterium RIFCSPHIGHO2_01_FULL_39_14]OGY49439.1 MAG: hypothetical protein A3D39_02790 [Candidatus Buchananbacteria bacterium RIFCSPHIGHO2_02_FULL_39_17]OGY55638.1 MAG: hypothetical protein A2912_05515 [Candidatus Buchananbacteria bacterium RIFCSPLOWO2_01_FULL_40_23b]
MFSEKKFSLANEGEPKIIIKRSTDAPPDVKQNPFYDSEFWGRANSPDDIYLPDSDEAISFAMAAHEIGHLVKAGERNDARLDNFEATRAEEQRAWDKGWEYLQEFVDEYYADKPECAPKIRQAFERIKTLLLQATDLSKGMYLENGALDNLAPDEIQRILVEKREKFFSEKGELFKNIFDEMKKEKIGIKPDWDKFTAIVTKAVENILKDNDKE